MGQSGSSTDGADQRSWMEGVLQGERRGEGEEEDSEEGL